MIGDTVKKVKSLASELNDQLKQAEARAKRAEAARDDAIGAVKWLGKKLLALGYCGDMPGHVRELLKGGEK